MSSMQALHQAILAGQGDSTLQTLYGMQANRLAEEKQRYLQILERFQEAFPEQDEVELFSSPGRTEVGGNHTDHNAGCVLAAAVDLDLLAVAARRKDRLIRVVSEGYHPETLVLDELASQEKEKFTSPP